MYIFRVWVDDDQPQTEKSLCRECTSAKADSGNPSHKNPIYMADTANSNRIVARTTRKGVLAEELFDIILLYQADSHTVVCLCNRNVYEATSCIKEHLSAISFTKKF